MMSLRALSGMLETRCLRGSCREGQPGLNCQTLPRSYSQLVSVGGLGDASQAAVEDPPFRYLLWGCATCRELELLLWKKGRQIRRRSGLDVLLIEAGFLFAQNQQVISAVILLYFLLLFRYTRISNYLCLFPF